MSAEDKDVGGEETEFGATQREVFRRCSLVGCDQDAEYKLRKVLQHIRDASLYDETGVPAEVPVCEEHFASAHPTLVRQEDAEKWVALQDSDIHEHGYCEVCGQEKDMVREITGKGFAVSVCMHCELFGEEEVPI